MNLENKITNEEGFFKRLSKGIKKAGIYCGLAALALLPSCVQYRARIMTRPPEEMNIYLDGELKGRTSKKEPVHVESSRQLQYPCKISLEEKNYKAYFWMHFQKDIVENESKETLITLDPKGRSEHCLSARVTRWEKGPSYDLVFEIPEDLLAELHKPIKKYTEWGDEIKEEPVVAKSKEHYQKPEIKPKELEAKKPETPADIGKLVDRMKPVEFFASLGIGNSFGGFGASGGVLFNLGKIPSIELSASLGYLFFSSDSELNTVAVEGVAAIHLNYFNNWSWYLKGFGGIQGKEVCWVGSTKTDETTLLGIGLIAGHRFMIKDTFFILTGGGFRYMLNNPDWAQELELTYAFEIGAGVKF